VVAAEWDGRTVLNIKRMEAMTAEGRPTELWQGKKAEQRVGCYEYKNVRFKLARSSRLSHGWNFQPFGRESRDFATWEEAVAALEETCTAIAQHRAERRNR
jgi:hypothetical protein